jgi:AraC-like DNA-binding protein
VSRFLADANFCRKRANMPARSTNPLDYQDVPRPVAVMAKSVADNHTTGWHRHKRAQLIFASSGVMVVKTHEGTWVIPPQRAVWVPSGVEHETRTIGAVEMRTVYVSPRAARTFSRHCCVVNVSELLRALILRASVLPLTYKRRGRDARTMQMILDEIESSKALPLHLPTPRHQRLAQLCSAIAGQANSAMTLADLAKQVGMSKRTAERLFIRETSMTFSRWRQQARLLTALTELASGHSVKQVAFKAGYSSQSAFSSMFKTTFGTTPRRYFTETGT